MARNRSKGDVRIGPISIIALVIILCLSVLGVLAAATAEANYLEADKQASFTSSTYTNETAAQEYLATVDASLAKSKKAGKSVNEALKALKKVVPDEATFDGHSVSIAFATKDGRLLSVDLKVTSDLTYRITYWKASTRWELDTSSGTLWQGQS